MDANTQPGWKKGFWCLMVTQSQNAFSDNALKYLIILSAFAKLSQAEQNSHVALVSALFAVPFILLSMFAGWMADRLSKQRIMSTVKVVEIGIMLFAAMALGLHLLPLQLAAIFMMGCHSAIFGPSKYGILPEILPDEKLSWGNGLLELLTFIGIIAGTVTGSFLAEYITGPVYASGLLLAALAVVGWRVSLHIPRVPAADPHCAPRFNPVSDLWRQLRIMRRNRDLWRANWGNTGFWFVAALVGMNLLIYATDVLHLNSAEIGLLNATLSIGIGIGSATAGFASRGRIQYGLVPIGAAGLALSTIPMGLAGMSTIGFSACLAALGFTGGLFIVPLAAALQHIPPPESKGAVQGAANLLSWIGIFLASAVQEVLKNTLGLTSGHIFWVCGAAALGTGIYAVATRREALRQLWQTLTER
jgi:acyl-[acyl-carrier-protein]-phospholipid O-acyltransferase/long-chain-fatty-acid--[acyl-carrier-protein] ligase